MLAAAGTFDTLHPFIVNGVPAAGIGFLVDTLTVRSSDEPSSEYGLIAGTIELPADRSWVAFTLRPQARFHDGSPITVDDVIWTFETLRARVRPSTGRTMRASRARRRPGPGRCASSSSGATTGSWPSSSARSRSCPGATGRRATSTRTTLDAPLGSGPYRVESFEPGRSITYRRVPDYWAADLPVNVGRFNVDRVRYDYYRDANVALEAFKAGRYDFREENTAKNWATAYRFPATSDGLVKKEAIRHEIPTGMQAFVFNTRRPSFRDARVRWALAHAFDFEWANAHLFFGAYTRTRSYFSNSELASTRPPGPLELEVLAPLRGKIPDEVFTTEYRPSGTDGPATCAPTSWRRHGFSRQPGGRSATSDSWTPAPGSPSPSRSSSRAIAPGSESPCPSPAISGASASTSTCARWTPPSTSTGPTPSTST